MMEEKAWSKLHLSLRGPLPCEKNSESMWCCFGISRYVRIFCNFLFSTILFPAVRERTIRIASLPNDVIYTSPHLVKTELRRCCCCCILVPNLVTWKKEDEEYKVLWISPISSGTPLYEEGMTFSNHNVRGLVKRTDVILPQCYNENAHHVPLQTCKRHKPTAWKK